MLKKFDSSNARQEGYVKTKSMIECFSASMVKNMQIPFSNTMHGMLEENSGQAT